MELEKIFKIVKVLQEQKEDNTVNKNIIPDIELGIYVIVRTYSAGVHAGFLKYHNKMEVVLEDSRRLYYWKNKKGISLSEISIYGLNEKDCKICNKIKNIYLSQVIEIIPCSVEAKKSIEEYSEYNV